MRLTLAQCDGRVVARAGDLEIALASDASSLLSATEPGRAPPRLRGVTDRKETAMTLTRQNVVQIGIAASALCALALAGANFGGAEGENGGVGPFLAMLGLSIAVAVAVFGWAIPRSDHPARAGLIAGALALLSLPLFWTGLPYVLGPAAVAFGLIGRARPEGRGAATLAVALGTLATVGAVAAVILDQTT
jgi:hypothetical protein